MPAVLLELGYLSNSKDRAVLTNEKNQITLAKALAEGVKNYASFCFKRK
jgi:N-acetylmuramoyl-L-alanine amidase